MTQEKDYSKLLPFDLEKAKAGEEVCYGANPDVLITFVEGPDVAGRIAYIGENKRLYVDSPISFRMAPLCWVEGKPVYKGDVLLGEASNGDWHEFKAEGVFEQQGATVLFPDDGRDGWLPLSRLRWTPPKVKREGWVNVYPVGKQDVYVATCTSAFASKEQADQYAGAPRIACIRIEWEEPGEVK